MVLEIPMKLPGFNQFLKECNKNKFAGANMKKKIEQDIGWYINKLPHYNKPVRVHFRWIENNRRRDLDNIASSKKFVLDAMVKCGVIKDDSAKYVVGFTDDFGYEKQAKVILDIEVIENEET